MKTVIRVVLSLISATILYAQSVEPITKAESFVREGAYENAWAILEPLYEKNDEDPQVNYLMGTIVLRQGDYDEAIDYLDVAIEGDDANYRYYYMLGNAYLAKTQNSGTLKAMFAAPKMKSNWEKAIELNPDYVPVKWALFQFHINAPGVAGGDDEEAFNLAKQVSPLNPQLAHLMYAAYYFGAKEDLAKTEEELRKSLKTDSTNKEYGRIINGSLGLLNTLGYHFLQKDEMKESYRFFKLAIETAPDRANPYDSMGDYYLKTENLDSALYSFQMALQQNPDFVPSMMNKARILEKLGNSAEALSLYKKIVSDHPESSYADQAEDRVDELQDL